jgi:hypothetical protein
MLIAKRDKWQFVVKTTLVALSSRSALSVLVGALFKKFSLFLNTPRMSEVCRKSNYLQLQHLTGGNKETIISSCNKSREF